MELKRPLEAPGKHLLSLGSWKHLEAPGGTCWPLETHNKEREVKNKLSLLDNRLLNSLNRLQRLDVSHNGISSVSESAFHGVGRLDYLNISHNNLRELKPKTFKGISKLIEFPKIQNINVKHLIERKINFTKVF